VLGQELGPGLEWELAPELGQALEQEQELEQELGDWD
jgi:hypothetical protein